MKHRLLKAILFGAGLVTASLPALMSTSAVAQVVYNRGNSADPETLDPHKSSSVYEAHIIRDLYEGLVAQDSKANTIPGTAESWSTSDDGTIYTFKLRADAVWSNGDPVTADDYVYSFRRLLDPATAAEYAGLYGFIVGAEEITKGTGKPEGLGVKAVDAKTLQISLKNPTPFFIELLTHQASFAVHKGTIEKFGADWLKPGNLVSNGAYTLKSFTPGDKIVLEKNPKFREASQVKIDVVNYFPTEDRAASLKRYENGELDSNDDIPTEQRTAIEQKMPGQFFNAPYLGSYYYSVKTDKAPLNNPKLRRALALMIDRDQLAEKVWSGTMVPAYSIIPPGMQGYPNNFSDFKDMAPIDREDEAKKILAELGYGPDKPLKLEIRFNTSDNHKNTAIAIADMMKPFGVEATLFNSDTKTHYGYLEQKGNYDLARAAWIADFKDPYTFLSLAETGNGSNYSNYSNPEYDAALKKAAQEADGPKRLVLLGEAEKIMNRDIPYIPLLYYGYHNLVSPKLKGFEQNVMDIHLTRYMTKE
jgi:oligopeptide transport system substrate-binding protein